MADCANAFSLDLCLSFLLDASILFVVTGRFFQCFEMEFFDQMLPRMKKVARDPSDKGQSIFLATICAGVVSAVILSDIAGVNREEVLLRKS